MNYIKILSFSITINICSYSFAMEEKAFELALTACEMCYHNRDDAAFVFAKSLVDKHKDDSALTQSLKEYMSFCRVSDKYREEAVENANEVIKISSDQLYVGVAWYNKSSYAYYISEDENALTYSAIALKILGKIPDTEPKGIQYYRKVYEFNCHSLRAWVYKASNEMEKAAEEESLASSKKDEFIKHVETK